MSANDLPPSCAPDLIEPVIGYRQWRMTDTGLSSIACDERWREASLVARCMVGGHPQEAAPVSACSCGVYAWYEPLPRFASAPTRDYVAGAVALWGAVELHGSGMRAQYCRIVALALPMSRWGKRRRLVDVAARLGVPAVRSRDLEAVARRHGLPVGDDLRPPPYLHGSAQGPSGLVGRTATRRPLR